MIEVRRASESDLDALERVKRAGGEFVPHLVMAL